MLFGDVRSALIGVLRARVRNGELTERGLARLVGVSQPHIHNVLKGARALSPELSDQILQHLRLSLLDLIQRETIEAHLGFVHNGGYVYVPLLNGEIGPGHAWPTSISSTERLPFAGAQVSSIQNPVAVRLAEDVRMASLFTAGDVALLDQSVRARSEIDSGAYFVVKSGNGGIVRRVAASGGAVYLIPEDAHGHPSAWQRVHMEGRPITHLVRARAYLVSPVCEWV
ncbi:MAG TPA: helix-turn-helix transcriptional regulator [Bryobacteraceae bacterium]|nr:helix-turn-helix transcriptional regulator [Bryobacteraceae bacterium]